MSHVKRLNTASGFFFFLGFVANKLTNIPIVLVATVANLISLTLYLIGYILWLIAYQLYPDPPALSNHWHRFTQFKSQHKAAAMLGILAFFLGVTGIFFPLALVASAWVLVLSNIVWCIGEYNKKKNPPEHDLEYSSTHQALYLSYAITLTLLSVVTALAVAISITFPLAAPLALLTSNLVGLCLGALAFNLWVDFSCRRFKPDLKNKNLHPLPKSSYNRFYEQNLLSNSKLPLPSPTVNKKAPQTVKPGRKSISRSPAPSNDPYPTLTF